MLASSVRGVSAAWSSGSCVVPRCYDAAQRAGSHVVAAQQQAQNTSLGSKQLVPALAQALSGRSKRHGSTLCRATGGRTQWGGSRGACARAPTPPLRAPTAPRPRPTPCRRRRRGGRHRGAGHQGGGHDVRGLQVRRAAAAAGDPGGAVLRSPLPLCVHCDDVQQPPRGRRDPCAIALAARMPLQRPLPFHAHPRPRPHHHPHPHPPHPQPNARARPHTQPSPNPPTPPKPRPAAAPAWRRP